MNLGNEDKARIKRDKAKDAIALALASRWEEAVVVNREIVGGFPRDVEALNRLGKALSELGQYREAKDAFGQTLEISPSNNIARKNLQRLAQLNEEAAVPKHGSKATPQLFIEERGKSASISLMKLPADSGHLRMAPGDAVDLQLSGDRLTVESPEGQYLGEIDPKLGRRLAKLIEGGNGYAAAITSVQERSLVVMIKETYQHRSQYGKVSFPNKQPTGGIYSYLGAPPLPADLDLEEEEIEIERPPIIDWDEEGEATIAAPPSDDDEPASSSRDDIEEQAGF
ncbi:MAG: tetratricopeptide repeat protein [Chloroflexi bacterium]|nr:tetratricopeptide repeat protein [Chloroflexota bacterium]